MRGLGCLVLLKLWRASPGLEPRSLAPFRSAHRPRVALHERSAATCQRRSFSGAASQVSGMRVALDLQQSQFSRGEHDESFRIHRERIVIVLSLAAGMPPAAVAQPYA